MLKKSVVFILLVTSLSGKYITKDEVVKDKKTLQVSSCLTRECVKVTQESISSYDYITVIENGYYVTYLVNIDEKKEDEIMSSYNDSFPDMILRTQYIEDKELYGLKALDKDFYLNKNYSTRVNTKKLDIYSKPTHTSNIIETKYFGDIINIDGCNAFEWCKIKKEKKYFPAYRVAFQKKLEDEPKKDIKETPKTKQNTQLNKKEIVDKYKTGLLLFKDKKYEESYKVFNELFRDNLNDVNINFYLGRSAFETKRYQESLTAYERILFEQPDNSRVKLEMARTYFNTGNYPEAKRLLLEVKEDETVPAETIKIVDIYLAAADDKISRHSLTGVLMGGLVYDSNINSSAQMDSEYVNYSLASSGVVADTNKQNAVYNQEIALVNYAYRLTDTSSLKSDVLLFNKDSFQSSYNSTDVVLVSVTPAYSKIYNEKLSVDYGLYADLLWYGNIKLLRTYAAIPKFTYIHSKENKITGYYKYQSKFNEVATSKVNDSIYMEAQGALSHTYSPTLTLSPSLTLANEKVKHAGPLEGVDYSSFKFALGTNYIYKPTLFFAPSLSYTYKKYEVDDSTLNVEKVNKEYKVAFAATYILTPKWIVQGSTDYTYQSSTIPSSDYHKHTFNVNIIRPF